jgi:hypothetical protein
MAGIPPPLAVLRLLVRMHARTAAPWIGATIAAGAVLTLASAGHEPADVGGARFAAALLAGALAQAATGAFVSRPAGDGGVPGAWLTRTVWPLGGACFPAVVGRWAGGPGPWEILAAAACAAALATAAVAKACERRGIPPADAMSIGLSTTAAAAATAGVCAGIVQTVSGAVAAWGAAAGAASFLQGRSFPGSGPGTPGDRPSLAAALLTHGSARAALSTLAMATALAGMVAWFFLDPVRGSWYPLLAVAWFVALVVPQATSLSAAGRAGVLVRSAPGVDGAWTAPPVRRARVSALTHALVLGWPAVVSLGLSGGVTSSRRDMAIWPALTLVVLAVAAASVTWLSWLANRFRLRSQTSRAVACAVAAMAGLLPFASLPRLPGPRGSPAAGVAVAKAVAGVDAASGPRKPRAIGTGSAPRGSRAETAVEKMSRLER